MSYPHTLLVRALGDDGECLAAWLSLQDETAQAESCGLAASR